MHFSVDIGSKRAIMAMYRTPDARHLAPGIEAINNKEGQIQTPMYISWPQKVEN